MNEVIAQGANQIDVIADLQHTENLVKSLMQSKHYAKMGPEGAYAIIQKAKSLGINPLEALNGALYYVQGKVEMTSQLMNALIRGRGHSIQKDEKSTKTNCILHGRRADNGDKWSVSFGLEDAKKAGLVKPGGPWEKYTEVMCFNRALSMLARQLFADVIKDCYITGEISDSPGLFDPVVEYISADQAEDLQVLISQDENPTDLQEKLLKRFNCSTLLEIPADKLEPLQKYVRDRQEKQKAAALTSQTVGE